MNEVLWTPGPEIDRPQSGGETSIETPQSLDAVIELARTGARSERPE